MDINIDEVLISFAKKQIIIEKQEIAIQQLLSQYNELNEKCQILEKELSERPVKAN